MTRKGIFIIASTVFLGVVAWGSVFAQQLSIEGNGAGSQTSIIIDSGTTLNVQQGGTSVFNTEINATSNTGGNSVSGNNGNSKIITGDAKTEIKVNNVSNSNVVIDPCCTTPTPTPKPQPTSRPNPTSTSAPSQPSNPGSSGSGSNSGTSSGSGSGAVGGAEIKGLSATSGELDLRQILLLSGSVVCLGLIAAPRLRSILEH